MRAATKTLIDVHVNKLKRFRITTIRPAAQTPQKRKRQAKRHPLNLLRKRRLAYRPTQGKTHIKCKGAHVKLQAIDLATPLVQLLFRASRILYVLYIFWTAGPAQMLWLKGPRGCLRTLQMRILIRRRRRLHPGSFSIQVGQSPSLLRLLRSPHAKPSLAQAVTRSALFSGCAGAVFSLSTALISLSTDGNVSQLAAAVQLLVGCGDVSQLAPALALASETQYQHCAWTWGIRV